MKKKCKWQVHEPHVSCKNLAYGATQGVKNFWLTNPHGRMMSSVSSPLSSPLFMGPFFVLPSNALILASKYTPVGITSVYPRWCPSTSFYLWPPGRPRLCHSCKDTPRRFPGHVGRGARVCKSPWHEKEREFCVTSGHGDDWSEFRAVVFWCSHSCVMTAKM